MVGRYLYYVDISSSTFHAISVLVGAVESLSVKRLLLFGTVFCHSAALEAIFNHSSERLAVWRFLDGMQEQKSRNLVKEVVEIKKKHVGKRMFKNIDEKKSCKEKKICTKKKLNDFIEINMQNNKRILRIAFSWCTTYNSTSNRQDIMKTICYYCNILDWHLSKRQFAFE